MRVSPPTRVEALPLSQLDGGQLVAAMDQYAGGGAALSSFDEQLLRQIQLCLDDGSPDPKYLLIGPENPAAFFFGSDFCREAIGTSGLPDQNFIDPLHARYAEVSWTRKPALDYIKGKCADWYVHYKRLILPVETNSNYCFACFLKPERMVRDRPSEPRLLQLETSIPASNHLPSPAG